MLYQSNWHLFILRRGLTLSQSVSRRQLRRIFTQYDNRFAECIPLLQHCGNVSHRHATNKAVAIRVNSHPEAFAKFQALVDDEAFQSKLLRAQALPKGAEAAEIMKTVVSFINAAAVKIPWGMRERANEVHALIAGQRAHGAAGIFYTCAPDDVHQPLAVRLSTAHRAAQEYRDQEYRRDVFPNAVEEAFKRALQGQTPNERVRDSDFEPDRKHRMDEATLQRLAAGNPIASVLTFNHLVENLRTNLLCQSLARPGNLTVPNACTEGQNDNEGTKQRRKKGVFGICFLNRDVKECNKRAAMHEHGQAHGGVPPALLADVASNDQLRQLALNAIDTHVKGELQLEYHAVKVLQDELKVPSRRDAAFEIPMPERTREEVLHEHCAKLPDRCMAPSGLTAKEAGDAWCEYLRKEWWPELLHHAQVVVMNRHTHEHQATCAGAGKDGKGKGKWMCR